MPAKQIARIHKICLRDSTASFPEHINARAMHLSLKRSHHADF
jgi:hypothetical protein